jgi:hypothetical protein
MNIRECPGTLKNYAAQINHNGGNFSSIYYSRISGDLELCARTITDFLEENEKRIVELEGEVVTLTNELEDLRWRMEGLRK